MCHRSTVWVMAVLLAVAGTTRASMQGGPTDRPKLDEAAAARGRSVYAAQCINCHGSTAKGGPNGPDLIRSPAVLRDRLGSGIGPAMRAAASAHTATMTQAQLVDLSHFLRQRVEAITRNRTATAGSIDVLTGDPEAGRRYFNGSGRCSTCHSPTGDFAGIATRTQDAVTLQQRMLFPTLARSTKRVEVTITPLEGPPITGELVRLDNFNVSIRDAGGDYRAVSRVPGVKVEVRDPLAVHHDLLDEYTDDAIHDVVAYLWTLK